jgi:TolB-like protein/DNA-binding winged helix-turn-helix (wHTH) protein/Flp pilus assembly protein TadD
MQRISHQTQSFDGFTLDLTRACLLRGTQEIKLRPKPFDALKYLVGNPGRLITKAELIKALWPDTAVTDDSLVQCLMEVRRALGDEAQQIIKTVHGRGYIFDREVIDNGPALVTTYTEETAGVSVIIEEEETNGHLSLETPDAPASRSAGLLPAYKATRIERLTTAIKEHRWSAAVGVLTLAAVAAATIYFTRPREAIDSVAVMPFVNVSGDPNAEYLSEGLSDNIINSLSQLPNLKVIALNSVLRYKGEMDPQVIGRKLNVRAVLMSRLVQHGNELSITMELIDVRDNRHLWGEQYDRKISDLPLVQAELSRQITEHLRLRLAPEDQQRLVKQQPKNAESYQLCLKGDYYLRKRTVEGEQKAVEYFQQAIDKDQNFARAYTGLADCYLQLGSLGWIPSAEAQSKAKDAVTKSLNLDDTLAGAHATLGWIRLNHEWDWAGAEQEFRRAIELNFNLVEAHQGYATYLSSMGRHEEAIAEGKRALDVDPLSININTGLGLTLYMARQYDQAIDQLRQTIDMDPNFRWAHRNLGLAYEQKMMYSEAIAELQKVQEMSRGDFGNMALGHVYAAAGMKDEALKVIAKWKERSQHEYIAPTRFAVVYAGLGEKDQAFEWLDKAFKEHDPVMRDLKVDPWFDNLRSDPRFADLLRRMKLAT